MQRSQKGFTLLELGIGIAIFAVISAIIIPILLAARVETNEKAAITALSTVNATAPQTFGAFSGLSPLKTIEKDVVEIGLRKGYCFCFRRIGTDWFAYAWPQYYQVSGERTFFIDSRHTKPLIVPNATYDGLKTPPPLLPPPPVVVVPIPPPPSEVDTWKSADD